MDNNIIETWSSERVLDIEICYVDLFLLNALININLSSRSSFGGRRLQIFIINLISCPNIFGSEVKQSKVQRDQSRVQSSQYKVKTHQEASKIIYFALSFLPTSRVSISQCVSRASEYCFGWHIEANAKRKIQSNQAGAGAAAASRDGSKSKQAS